MDGIAEPQETSEPIPSESLPCAKRTNPNLKTPITAENAREMALRSHAKRKQRMEKLRQAAEPIAQGEQEYRLFRLVRTREQLLALDKQLEACTDPKLVKSLADAIARLCDVEQKLAMRPLPGSHRPSRQAPSKRTGDVGPVE